MLPRYALALTVLTLVGVAGVFGKRSDADALAAVGQVIATKARAGLPEHSPLAGPLTALKPSDKFPLEERVRARIGNDKQTGNGVIDVRPGATPGDIRLRGVVPTQAAKVRAIELAAETVGVGSVTADELAVR